MKSRVITALLIAVVVIFFAWYSPWTFMIFAIFTVVSSTYEFLALPGNNELSKFTKTMMYILTLAPLLILRTFENLQGAYVSIYFLVLFSLVLFDKKLNFKSMSTLVTLAAFAIPASLSVMWIRWLPNGFEILIFVIWVTAMADTGGLLFGMKFGKHKILPRLSPKKSWEGLLGGAIFAVVLGWLYSLVFDTGLPNTWAVIVVCLIFTVMGLVGDLFFSSIKRTYNLKDFSNFLPGHGGVLDRVDSHLFNYITFYIILSLFVY